MNTRTTIRRRQLAAALLIPASLLVCGTAAAAPRSYQRVVMSVAGMVNNERAQALANARRLEFLNVLWEDTGRYEGSSVGPNISDVTIEVEYETRRGKLQSALMPVLRFPNFSDRTADLKIDKLFIRVGNERQGGLHTIGLRDFLLNPTAYMSQPEKGRIKGGSLLAKRDRHVLVSAQAAFLPIRKDGGATFRPVIFNYQSSRRHPAVLTLLVTREGTSMTVIDNHRDTISRESWGQRLFFNAGGQRAALTAERLSDVKRRGTTSDGQSAANLNEEEANLLMLIQVPLKVRPPRPRAATKCAPKMDSLASGAGDESARRSKDRGGSDVEAAVLGHGKLEGPYVELAGLTVQRDPRFPIRATVQFYQATSNGVVSRGDITRLGRQIAKVYRKGDYVGSLVVPEGDANRPTRWTGISAAPATLTWRDFPGLVERANRYGYRSLAWFSPSPILLR
jgi:hypothetical protein